RAGEQRLEQALRSLSAEAIDKNNATFAQLVAPLRENLAKVENQVSRAEHERVDAYAGLREQVELMHRTNVQLRSETAQLVAALRAPQVRGRWGEHRLRRIVEAAGMVERCDFVEQQTLNTADGIQRPDMIVKLADGKNVIVDSKVPFSAYLEAMEARDDHIRNERLGAHAKHMRHHVDALSRKAYWDAMESTPEFVVLFVPADTFLDAAVQKDATLLEYAFERNIVLATPSTLVALLRTIAYSWRQEALARNAAEVHQLGRELYSRLSTMGDHWDKLGSSINSMVQRYNGAVASLEGRVMVTARKFGELQGVTGELAAPKQVEAIPRQLQASELTNG
ncbi:MAG: DNA recombination protein RmuC, partial [Mycobacteriales bacterium]